MGKAKLWVASARLPVTMTRHAEGWEVRPSTGGLVTALNGVAERRAFSWVGWPGSAVAEGEQEAVRSELARRSAVPVFLAKSDIAGFYEGFSNRVLWPLFHAQGERSRFDRAAWRAYQRVNQRFADALCALAAPGDTVWIHDYQLALVPELLRRRGLACRIGFFLHIPFPAAQIYRSLVTREEILRGLLGADLVAFHSYEYVSHFRSACLRVLGLESAPGAISLPSHQVELGVLPIGIDPDEFAQLCASDEAKQELARLRTTHAAKQLVVGVDRLDYTKGIREKLSAYATFLSRSARHRERVVLIQIAAPSRTGVEEYQALKREVDEQVGSINGRFGTASHTPLVYVNQAYTRARLAGLYQAAKVALVTPVRDGMNLVALEYIAARRELGGTLLLSEFTGAAHCLPGARLVNPHNTEQVATELAEALSLVPSPVSDSFQTMLEFVDLNTSARWAERFLERLERTPPGPRPHFQRLDVQERALSARLAAAERPLVLLDYDGTLRDFVTDPARAEPDAALLALLERLASHSTLYIVSGRAKSALEGWLGGLPIGLVCEHGLGVRHPGGAWEHRPPPGLEHLRQLLAPLLADFVARTPGSRVEQKEGGVAWHYRAADPEFGAFQATELQAQLEDTLERQPFNVLRGNRVLEVRSEFASKGRALATLLAAYPHADLLLCAGDDRTDEEMMRAIPSDWRERTLSCWVGSAHPVADYWVEGSAELKAQLSQIASLWAERAAT
ncbi:MAG: bifunctional alpha,alpha-trehalose-phosphate synthase (UDP-forming)/trehalose-phosphatase [Polyangiaceae bacterium]|nr:bifunctional alpha,alpha-trehalose-phosphate synthase (UDP-forming)/trehalose-phosphatase [Polyangiaceae bacterium]MCW5791436.1 bifunctional alpha,alpha-trehalose-phosphate synthase (UDP-forming)/trehalose-phosphatase [Polyangiaceae bacterium]